MHTFLWSRRCVSGVQNLDRSFVRTSFVNRSFLGQPSAKPPFAILRGALGLAAMIVAVSGAGPAAVAQTTGPDLTVSKDTSLFEVRQSEPVRYDFTYANQGPVAATGVTLLETVPAFTTAGVNPGWEVAPAGSGLPCDSVAAGTACARAIGTLASGAAGSATFELIADAQLNGVRFITNTAAIGDDGSAGFDPDTSNNFASISIEVFEQQPALLPLATIPVPVVDLSDFLKSNGGAQWVVVLGKALFWDMQVGSDGVQACATCHFNAGADSRSRNQLNPGSVSLGGTTFGFGAPNFQLIPSDYPFHQLADPTDRNAQVLRSTDEVTSSQGVVLTDFKRVRNQAKDKGKTVVDPVWNVGGVNVRRVEPRNTPSVINAVFNFRNFWDGRAQNEFNGVNPCGDRDPDARILERIDDVNVREVSISIKNSALASQAVGPPASNFEMSWGGRTWPDIGKKIRKLNKPLQMQQIDPADSVLGIYSNAPTPGMTETYRQLIKRSFKQKWWKSDAIIRVTPAGLAFDVQPPGFKVGDLADNEYTLMMYNFSLFFGLAVQAYERTLIADDSRFDRWLTGDATALNQQELSGLGWFITQGRCNRCHSKGTLSNATVDKVFNEPIERMLIANHQIAVYDNGFYNIGVRPKSEDVAVGGVDRFGLPLSMTGLAQQGLLGGIHIGVSPEERTAITGSFKTPQLRNVGLTAPYFHNGGEATLRQVVEFYNRGGDFHDTNLDNLDSDIRSLGLTETQIDELVAFLLSLTDARVELQQAPFDHPQIFVPFGHPTQGTGVVPSATDPLVAEDQFLEIPATGAAGGLPLERFLGIVEQP